jgi:hypothetical protein
MVCIISSKYSPKSVINEILGKQQEPFCLDPSAWPVTQAGQQACIVELYNAMMDISTVYDKHTGENKDKDSTAVTRVQTSFHNDAHIGIICWDVSVKFSIKIN